MTAVSPERAAYEAGRWPDVIPWEEAFPEVKEKFRAIAQAAIGASPELAEARLRIDELAGLVAEILAHPGTHDMHPLDRADFLERAGIKPAEAGTE